MRNVAFTDVVCGVEVGRQCEKHVVDDGGRIFTQ
jgi:hypothetical protein